MNRYNFKRISMVSLLLLCVVSPKQLYAVDLNQDELINEETITTEELWSVNDPLIEESYGSPLPDVEEVFEETENDKDAAEDEVDETKEEIDEISVEASNDSDSTVVDFGYMASGTGMWIFYSDGLLYFDGIVTTADLASWNKYAEDIKNIETNRVEFEGDISRFFSSFSNVETIKMVETDLSRARNMNGMFRELKNLRHVSFGITDIRFGPSDVKDMTYMFYGCSSLIELDLSNFNTESVTSMERMFNGCSRLTKLDLSDFNTESVTSMERMFYGCSSLIELDLSNFNTESVTNMAYMFIACRGLTKLDVSNFKTESVTNMERMFYDCYRLTELDVSNFKTESVTNMDLMFRECGRLTKLDVSNFNTASVIRMDFMFYGCKSLTELDVSNFNTASATSTGAMFQGCESLTELDVSNFNTASVTTMESMFQGCESLTELDVSNFKTASVRDMQNMFNGCSRLTELDMSNFNTESVTSMNGMFSGMLTLEKLNMGSQTKLNSDVSLRPSLPSKFRWRGTLEANSLANSEDLIDYHNNLNQENTYILTETVSISFDSVGGSPVNPVQTFIGDFWSEPTNPTKAGFIFSGWFLDKEYTQPFDFATPASQDTTVYAKWSEEYIVHIPAKIRLNSEDTLGLSGINNGSKTLNVAINKEASKIDDSRKLQLNHKKDTSISTTSQLAWESDSSNSWSLLSVPAEETKDSEIRMNRPENSQAGQYEGQLIFTISYE